MTAKFNSFVLLNKIKKVTTPILIGDKILCEENRAATASAVKINLFLVLVLRRYNAIGSKAKTHISPKFPRTKISTAT